ncbi:MAG: hypothetical protein ACTSYL_09725 [Candidatus Thorarchaeota archaeon]
MSETGHKRPSETSEKGSEQVKSTRKRQLSVIVLACSILGIAQIMPLHPLTVIGTTIITGYILTLLIPCLLLETIYLHIQAQSVDSSIANCSGVKSSPALIGYAERSLVFVIFLIAFFDSSVTIADLLKFIAIIVAAKFFRKTERKICEDWYILGTFISIAMSLFLSWFFFQLLTV